MADPKQNAPTFAWVVLIGLGIVDLIRGFMHTFMVRYAAPHIAGLDLSCAGQDQMFLLAIFGISNYLTGIVWIIIGLKARDLAPTMLALIPLTYVLGTAIIRMNVTPQSAFRGSTFMMVYFAVCIITFIASVIMKRRQI